MDIVNDLVVGSVIPAAKWYDEIYISDKWKENTDYPAHRTSD